MSTGKCLCGSVTWEISGTPEFAYNCHCSMCRKAHGAAFGTYYFVKSSDFRWTGSQDSVKRHASSDKLTRSFCGTCGSVTPDPDDDGVFVPAGCHDDGPPVDAHIFVGSRAPWYEISDDLPQHETYPPGQDLPICADRILPSAPDGRFRGSCLCNAVEFLVQEPFRVVYNCHCSRCRQARSAAFTTNGFTTMDGVRYVKGEEHLSSFKSPDARFFTQVFCSICGSGLPRIDAQRKIAVTPLGALDDDPGCKPTDNIFVSHKADWFDICDSLPAHGEGPPG